TVHSQSPGTDDCFRGVDPRRRMIIMLRRLALVSCLATGLLPGQQPREASSPASPTFQISGIVVDAAQTQPLAGARRAMSPVTQRDAFTTVVTGEDGRFTFPGLSAGRYALTAQHRGYITQSFNAHGQFASSVAVGPQLDATGLVFTINAESAIAGSVIDEQ